MGSVATLRRLTRFPQTLTARLVATAVALVAVVGLLGSGATALVMKSYLTAQLDQQLAQSIAREANVQGDRPSQRGCPVGQSEEREGEGVGRGLPPGQSSGTLTIRQNANETCAFVINQHGEVRGLDGEQVQRITSEHDGRGIRTVVLPHLGSYRVLSNDGAQVTVGLPTGEVDRSMVHLVVSELALTGLGVLLAATAGFWLVRRQLRPLRAVANTAHEVTAQDLASGKPVLQTRVPVQFTHPGNEVGQMGTALNTLLDHVDAALAARHASEQQV